MTINYDEIPDEPQYPDPALIASIEHQAEKLGYLIAQVEELFAKRAKEARHIALYQHGLENYDIQRKWLASEINDAEAAQLSAQLAERTSALNDEIREIFTINMNRLNDLVAQRVDAGKGTVHDLDNFLKGVLDPNPESE